MKIGLIGYGAWGSHLASALAESGDWEIAAVCSQSEPSRQAASKKLGVPTFADYRDLIARRDLDAVGIVLPTHLHREVAAPAPMARSSTSGTSCATRRSGAACARSSRRAQSGPRCTPRSICGGGPTG